MIRSFLSIIILFLGIISRADTSAWTSDFAHKFDGVDLKKFHSYKNTENFPLMEGLLVYMCVTNDCEKVWDAYYASSYWARDLYDGAQRTGNDLQKEYLPNYISYMVAPIAGAAIGRGEMRISSDEVIVLNTKQPLLAYKYEF